MDPAATLADHHRIDRAVWRVGDLDVPIRTKVGVRGHPGVDPALIALAEPLRRGRMELDGRVLDLTGAPAALPVWATGAGVAAQWTVASTSAATIAAARATLAAAGLEAPVVAALPWEVEERFDAVVWRPPADRGVRRVAAELAAVARRLCDGGTAWLLQHKDEGAKRTEKAAAERFASADVVAREGGWRLSALRGPLLAAEVEPWTSFAAPDGPMHAILGAFAAEKVDPGTRVLLATLAEHGSAPGRLLDLGCGTGLLARAALVAGALEVVAVDDDLAAVRSAARNLGDDPRARVVHADLTAGEVGSGFDEVWCNPPFHVGRQVVGALSRAFVAAAHEALRPGGEAWFVANRALPYEAELEGWAAWGDATPAAERSFKVLWARRSG
ncbi:MAG: class I SAM-dependent methyltransferase [Trueperaceae bacterium]